MQEDDCRTHTHRPRTQRPPPRPRRRPALRRAASLPPPPPPPPRRSARGACRPSAANSDRGPEAAAFAAGPARGCRIAGGPTEGSRAKRRRGAPSLRGGRVAVCLLVIAALVALLGLPTPALGATQRAASAAKNSEDPGKSRGTESGTTPSDAEHRYKQGIAILNSLEAAPIETDGPRGIAALLPGSVRTPLLFAVSAITRRKYKVENEAAEDAWSQPGKATHSRALLRAFEHLQAAADAGHPLALSKIADAYFYGHHGVRMNFTAAYNAYSRLAENSGNATAQYRLGLFHALGLGDVVPRDPGKALQYYTFAALGDDVQAQMTLGFRYLMGVGVQRSCEKSVAYYKRVADKAIQVYLSGPPNGRPLPPAKPRVSDVYGGIYGPGASTSGPRDGGVLTLDAAGFEDLLEHYRYTAERGDFQAQLVLGKLYYHGTKLLPQNFRLAMKHLRPIAKEMFSGVVAKGGPSALAAAANAKPELAKAVAQAAGFIGLMYWRGEGVPQNNITAFKWFQRGAELGNAVSLNALGVMYQDGVDVPQDRERANQYFKLAAELDNADAQVNMALVHRRMHDMTTANGYLQHASLHNHILAHYYLALMSLEGEGVKSSCPVAATYFKSVTERADWLTNSFEFTPPEQTHSPGEVPEVVLLGYLMAAEMGYEVGQSNAAWILETAANSRRSFPTLFPVTPLSHMALIMWTRAANQGNVDARVKMGDYYYYGLGGPGNATLYSPTSPSLRHLNKPNYAKAATCYKVAGESENSGLALWNLGWMHEHGIGVPRDYHMAKRWYDASLEANPEGHLAVQLSHLRLFAKYYWAKLTGDEAGRGSLFAEAVPEPVSDEFGGADSDDLFDDEYWEDTAASAGSSPSLQAEQPRRWGAPAARRRAAIGGIEDEDGQFLVYGAQEEDMLETLIILCLCMIVGWLVYVRQLRMRNVVVANNAEIGMENGRGNVGNNPAGDDHRANANADRPAADRPQPPQPPTGTPAADTSGGGGR